MSKTITLLRDIILFLTGLERSLFITFPMSKARSNIEASGNIYSWIDGTSAISAPIITIHSNNCMVLLFLVSLE